MIDLYYWPTPNGHKITLMLEELAEAGAKLDYRIIPVDIGKGDQFKPEYLAFSPNNKMPAIIDHAPADGSEPISVFESGAILLYLANRTGRFFGADTRQKVAVTQWLMWQMGGLGPMTGQYGHFTVYAPEKIPYAIDRYTREVQRLLGVLDRQPMWQAATTASPTWRPIPGSMPTTRRRWTCRPIRICNAGTRRSRHGLRCSVRTR